MKKLEKTTLKKLAQIANCDLDTALITLWDNGLDDVNNPSDELSGPNLKIAKNALGIPTRQQLKSFSYWEKLLLINEQELRVLLNQLRVPISKNAWKLPKGAIKKLKSESLKKNHRISQSIVALNQNEEIQDEPAVNWKLVGHKKDVRLLEVEEVLAIHNELVLDFQDSDNPIDPPLAQVYDLCPADCCSESPPHCPRQRNCRKGIEEKEKQRIEKMTIHLVGNINCYGHSRN